MRFILFWFGYIKIPKEVVELSVELESRWKVLSEINDNIKIYYMMQRSLTDFLRSGYKR